MLPAGVVVRWRAIAADTPRREVSRALLTELLPGARFVSRCAACGGDHGRVRVEGSSLHASIAYVPGWAVVAVVPSEVARHVGVDAVPADAAGWERVATGGARAWARIEAALKADGRGLRVDPDRIDVRDEADGWWARVDGGPRLLGFDVAGPPDVLVSVALEPAA